MTWTLRTLPTCDALQLQMPRKQANKEGNCHRFHCIFYSYASGEKTRKDTVYLLRPRYKTMQDWPCTRDDKGPFILSCHVMSAPLCTLCEHYFASHNTQFLIHIRYSINEHETWKLEILTVNYKIHLFFSSSCTVVGPACVHPCIFFADRNKSELSCFRSRTFHLCVVKPHHMRVWFARRFTADLNMSSLIVICIYRSWISDNGWLCKHKESKHDILKQLKREEGYIES